MDPGKFAGHLATRSIHGGLEGHNATIGGALLARDEELVERLRFVCNAVGSTHAPIPPDERRAVGICDGLVRLSVGLEDTGDTDFDEALGALRRGAA